MPFINYNTHPKTTIFPGAYSAMEHSEKITFGCVSLDEGVAIPEHSHPQEQWTYCVEGQMEFTLEGEKQLLTPGIGAFIPSNALHSAFCVTACKVIDVFTPMRQEYKELDADI